MGKTPAKLQLTIGVPHTLSDRPEVQDLVSKGHVVVWIDEVDVILDESTLSRKTYLDAALRGARARKKGKNV